VAQLHVTTVYRHVSFVRFLIEHGADASVNAHDEPTPLHLASCYVYVELVRIHTEHGADATTWDNDEKGPLHMVSSHGKCEGCTRLRQATVRT